MSAGLRLVGEDAGGAPFLVRSSRLPEGFHLSNPVRAPAEGAYEKIALCAAVR